MLVAGVGAMSNRLGYIYLPNDHEIEARNIAAKLNEQEYLDEMARCLNEEYFDLSLDWSDIRFVTSLSSTYGQHKHYGGRDHRIRINHRMSIVEEWITEVLVMHEVCHTVHPNHSAAFWKLVDRHPNAAEAEQILNAGGPIPQLSGCNLTTRGWDFLNYPEFNLENYINY